MTTKQDVKDEITLRMIFVRVKKCGRCGTRMPTQQLLLATAVRAVRLHSKTQLISIVGNVEYWSKAGNSANEKRSATMLATPSWCWGMLGTQERSPWRTCARSASTCTGTTSCGFAIDCHGKRKKTSKMVSGLWCLGCEGTIQDLDFESVSNFAAAARELWQSDKCALVGRDIPLHHRLSIVESGHGQYHAHFGQEDPENQAMWFHFAQTCFVYSVGVGHS